jgi:hypothetical protein
MPFRESRFKSKLNYLDKYDYLDQRPNDILPVVMKCKCDINLPINTLQSGKTDFVLMFLSIEWLCGQKVTPISTSSRSQYCKTVSFGLVLRNEQLLNFIDTCLSSVFIMDQYKITCVSHSSGLWAFKVPSVPNINDLVFSNIVLTQTLPLSSSMPPGFSVVLHFKHFLFPQSIFIPA